MPLGLLCFFYKRRNWHCSRSLQSIILTGRILEQAHIVKHAVELLSYDSEFIL